MFNIGNVVVGGTKTVLIAEAGVNHLKDRQIANRLIESAAIAGADIIKFQTYSADKLVTKNAPRFWSWDGEQNKRGTQHDSYKVLETPNRDFTEFLIKQCEENNVEFMSTPFDSSSLDMLDSIGCKGYKIASGDITNLPFLREVAEKGKPVFLSTGASTLTEVDRALCTLRAVDATLDICVMHCILCYPTKNIDANLGAIEDLKENFPGEVIGYSDHTIGPEIPAASILYGVKAIEKHYTVDKTLPDSADHWLSVDERELSSLREMLDVFEQAVGDRRKGVLLCEETARANARRSIVTVGQIKQGQRFTERNLTTKRPGYGLSPVFYDELLGLTASETIPDDTVITSELVVEDASFKPITEASLKIK